MNVDEDTEKFGRPPLPVVLSAAATRAYLDDLVRHRLVTSLERLRASLVRR